MLTNMIENPVRQLSLMIFNVKGTWSANPQKIFGVQDALYLARKNFSERSEHFSSICTGTNPCTDEADLSQLPSSYLKLLAGFFGLRPYFQRYHNLSGHIHFSWIWIYFPKLRIHYDHVGSSDWYYANLIVLDHTWKELKSVWWLELSFWRTVSTFISH